MVESIVMFKGDFNARMGWICGHYAQLNCYVAETNALYIYIVLRTLLNASHNTCVWDVTKRVSQCKWRTVAEASIYINAPHTCIVRGV